MKKNYKCPLLLIVFLLALKPIFAQSFLWVSGEGNLINYPYIMDCLPDIIYPKVKPNTKSITVDRYLLKNSYGELYRFDTDGQYTMHYDTTGNLVKIQNGSSDTYGTIFYYDGDRVVGTGNNYGCRFKYDEKGRLESMIDMYDALYKYTLDNNGNITRIDEYQGKEFVTTHTFRIDKRSHKADYHATRGSEHLDIIVYFDDAEDVQTIMAYREKRYLDGSVDYRHNEYRFEYGTDKNPIRCIKTEIGDIAVDTKGYEYNYTYEFYPTKEELERQAEEERRIKAEEEERQRIATLKQSYSSCRFLFDSEEAFESCITNESEAENKIIELLGKKIDEISQNVKTGKELQDLKSKSRRDMLSICNMTTNSTTVSTYKEQKLKEFVSERKVLNRDYKKSKSSYYTLFLRYYPLNIKNR